MPQPKLLECVRERLRLKHYSPRTEDAFLHDGKNTDHWVQMPGLLATSPRTIDGAIALPYSSSWI